MPRKIGGAKVVCAFAGIASVSAGLGAAEIVAQLFFQNASPIFSTGSLVIDLAPPWLKELVIGWFGTGDKVVILVAVCFCALVLASIAGILEHSRPPWGRVLIGLVGAFTSFAALTRSNATVLVVVPSLIAVTVALVLLSYLLRRIAKFEPSATPGPSAATGPSATTGQSESNEEVIARRSFLISATLATGLGILATVGSQVAGASVRTAEAIRRAFQLPIASKRVAPLATGTSLEVAGISPIITPNSSFYRIDTALIVPSIDPANWSLKVHGMVEEEVTLSFDELLALPLEESYTTLACVSNYVGGELIGNAKWLGYPIRKLIEQARPKPEADMVLSRSIDGFTASTPLAALTDDRNAILAVAMNEKPLPAEHGFPVRMVVPGLYGYVSATKWITELKLTRFNAETAFWTTRGWSEKGPVKLSSRIDTPKDSQKLNQGTIPIAGVAWAQHTGISQVEVRIDGGEWMQTQLSDAISIDTWRQWVFYWDAVSGDHKITVRAIDSNGKLQVEKPSDVAPDGATGLHSVFVNVA